MADINENDDIEQQVSGGDSEDLIRQRFIARV